MSGTVSDVEQSVDAAADAADAVSAALGSLTAVRAAFESAADPRREAGKALVSRARSTLAAVHEGTLAFVEADQTMAASTTAARTATEAGPPPYSSRRFGQVPQ
ncbi:hypothetical protein QQX02_01735 [Demequina sp. EGI L300058]|uniref:Excreted virulence factor EspC, type VII ESX diderm n=1 Tax=Demequina muriae TaxID=3051664 RepID=A0ABT8GED7_9MICO|nr:hypothetical protein [Demequina sp. EGI L300058]MDN4479646.1 hypothetical protein [Demequina sp. EGI L300058]